MRSTLLSAARRSAGLALLLVVLPSVGTTACSDRAARSPLADARRSPEALANAALDAINAGDEDGLVSLMITRDEYENLVWPILPDRNQMPFAFAWSITGPRSRKARNSVLNDYRGVPLELVRVELGQGENVEHYNELTLYRRSRMVVRRTDTGAEGVLPLMDTLIEMNGGWKFMNFVDDA
jgi:hypothetical protein